MALPPKCPKCPTGDIWAKATPFSEITIGASLGCFWCEIFRQAIHQVLPETAQSLVYNWVWDEVEGSIEGFEPGSLTITPFRVDLFTKKEDIKLSSSSRSPRPLPSHTSSDESLQAAKGWLADCIKSHIECQISDKSFCPSRLLDLESPGCDSAVKLIDVEVEGGNKFAYACLSYCWGTTKPLCMTTRATLEDNKLGIRWNNIPRTFQDAICFSRALKIRYLWIDSLCIIQDDRNDWMQESATMADIFSYSTITLAATGATGSNQGLFSPLSPEHKVHEIHSVLPDGSSLLVFARQQLHQPVESMPDKQPLLRRGWVFQERLLSPRVLHFTSNELVWECMGEVISRCQCCVVGGTSMKCIQSRAVSQREFGTQQYSPAAEWFNIIHSFSPLLLTFQEDRLPAISGAAKRTRQFRYGDEYLAGLWKGDLPQGLGWGVMEAPNHRTTVYTAPSWSWASLDAGVGFAWWITDPTKMFVTIDHSECRLAGPDPTGQVVYASITLSGPTIEATIECNKDSTSREYTIHVNGDALEQFLPDFILREDSDCGSDPSISVYCLLLYEHPGGVVSKIGEMFYLILIPSPKQTDYYERIGLLRCSREEHDSRIQSSLRPKTITII